MNPLHKKSVELWIKKFGRPSKLFKDIFKGQGIRPGSTPGRTTIFYGNHFVPIKRISELSEKPF